uniref:Uncharacterized protein n=1 Tax=Glossina morsitans morsitans TaxID=37546 RepID=A0A1B0G3Q7_GLOMM
MDDAINGGEGRVTRSLRKRLTSIDSETTSRPGTPVQSVKLNTISERTTASPPRTTRSARQATTPLKTPAKRLSTLITDIVGSAETTPVKRLTRRRFSADRQTLAKVTDCDPLAEKVRSPSVEIQPAEQSESKTTKRKMRRPGPRSKTRDNLDTLDSDVEIIGEELTFNTKDIKIETCIDLSGDNEENIAELSIMDPRDSKLGKQETHTIIDISEDQEEYVTIENSANAKSLSKDMELKASSPEVENQAKNSKPDERKQEHLESHLSDCKASPKNISMNGQTEYNITIDSKEIAANDEKSEEVQRSSISNKTMETDNTNEVNGSSAEILQNPMGYVKNLEAVSAVDNEKDVQDASDDNLPQPPLTTLALKETPRSETANTSLEARPEEARVIEVVEICKPSDISKYITDPSEKLEDKIVEEKNVLFANVAHDETPKQVFPKTPIISKTRSYIEANCSSEDNSFHSTKDSGEKSFDQHMIKEEEIPGKEEKPIQADKSIDDDVSQGEVEGKRYYEEQSPLNVKRKIGDTTQMQSSTPIALHNSPMKTAQEFPKISLNPKAPAYDKDDSGNKSTVHFLPEKNLTSTESSLCPSPKLSFNEHSNLESSINEKKNENLLNENTKNKCHEKDNETTKTEAQNSLLKWTQPQAIGDITTNQKLDVIDIPIVDNSKDKNILAKIEIPARCESRESMSLHFPSEEEAEEENQLQRNELIDDEAMEIDGYKSGDSLTYEERRELEENEIPIAGESLGSHTTTDDEENEDDNDEDTDDKEDSFIVPDDEEEEENIPLEYSDDNEHISELKTNKKQYKRLQCLVDSSSSSENENEKKPQDRKDNLESGNDSLLSYGEESTKKNGKESNTISKLSDSAKRLSDSIGLDSDMNMDENAEINQARRQTLNDKGAKERFHKSLRKLQVSDSTDDENDEENPKFETKKKRSSFPATLAPLKKRLALSSTNKLSKSLIEHSGGSARDTTAHPIEQDTTKKKLGKKVFWVVFPSHRMKTNRVVVEMSQRI